MNMLEICDKIMTRNKAQIIRKEAKTEGLKFYFTGKPCKHGHINKQYVSTGACIKCAKENSRKWQLNNPELKKESKKKWNGKNKEQIKEYQKKYSKTNPEKILAKTNKRRATKLQATPNWYEKDLVEAIYKQAIDISKKSGIQYHVDHIIPLINKMVCGLHCKDNLQIITATENCSKHNKFKI